MELTISGPIEFETGSLCQIELPYFVSKLTDEEIIAAETSTDRDYLVIAAGTNPRDGMITLLTAARKIFIFDGNKYYIPPGPSCPSHGGSQIFLKNIEGRWPGNTPGFFVDASWMIQKSTSGLGSSVKVNNYQHENKPQSAETTDT